MKGEGVMWVAEVGKGLEGARGAQRFSGQAWTCSTTPRFREAKTVGPGSARVLLLTLV